MTKTQTTETEARIILVDHSWNSEQQAVDVFAVPVGSDPADVLHGWLANQPNGDTEGNDYRCEISAPDMTKTQTTTRAYRFTELGNIRTACEHCAETLVITTDDRGNLTAVMDDRQDEPEARFAVGPLYASDLEVGEGCDSCDDRWTGSEWVSA